MQRGGREQRWSPGRRVHCIMRVVSAAQRHPAPLSATQPRSSTSPAPHQLTSTALRQPAFASPPSPPCTKVPALNHGFPYT